MPFSVIPVALGTAFVLVWLFIGGMILRDGQRESRRRREQSETKRVKLPHQRSTRRAVNVTG